MSLLRTAPIVEGHGEVRAIRLLLQRIWNEMIGGDHIDVLSPIRIPRTKLIRSGVSALGVEPNEPEVGRAVELAARKLRSQVGDEAPELILILLDSNGDCPKELAPLILEIARERSLGIAVACVLANPEYETWFVGAAESLGDYLKHIPNSDIPTEPELSRSRKGWIAERFARVKYSETVDQPRLTAKMDIKLCRSRCPSFDKLCRVLEAHKT